MTFTSPPDPERNGRLTRLTALSARLTGRLDPAEGGPGHELSYELQMALAADEAPAELRLTGLVFTGRSWRQLAGQVLTFDDAVALDDGQPTRWMGLGKLRLGADLLPVTATRVAISPADGPGDTDAGTGLRASVDAVVEGAATPLTVSAPLVLGPVTVTGPDGGDGALTAVADTYLNRADYVAHTEAGRLVLTPVDG